MKLNARFRLNKSLDKEMAFEFLAARCGGVDFSQGVLNVHPKLQRLKEVGDEKKREVISNYFDAFYDRHEDYLEKRKVEFGKEWKEVENKFLIETEKIFRGHPFPRGKYIGFLSIIDCNPRFLKNKTFQVFYLHPHGVRYVTAHELLHFIFYDYAIKKCPELFRELDTESGIFWDLAEVFNSIILHTPGFVKIHGIKEEVVYPEHLEYVSRLDRVWRKHQDVDRFIVAGYKAIFVD